MRTILFTGKGGVGKTSVAAATALRSAAHGKRTLVMSTDVAHSLGDSLDVELTSEPTSVAPNLWAQEVDVYHEIHHHWGNIQEYLLGILSWRGLDDVVSEEMAIFPGMEELSSLLLLTKINQSKQFDTVIVDCAPTGETLRLLSFPDVSRWWLKNIFPVQRKAYQFIRPIVRPLTDMPLPGNDVLDSIQSILVQLDQMHRILSDPASATIRLVLNPERMVVKEAQRTFTYLNLYGYSVDAIIENRIIPPEVDDQYFQSWKTIQEKNNQLVEECFAPLPILRAPLFREEVVGQRMLNSMASTIYGERDPSEVFYTGRTQTVIKEHDQFILELPLPLATKDKLEVISAGEELVIRVGNQRRNVILPRALIGLEISEAKLDPDALRITFQKKAENKKGR